MLIAIAICLHCVTDNFNGNFEKDILQLYNTFFYSSSELPNVQYIEEQRCKNYKVFGKTKRSLIHFFSNCGSETTRERKISNNFPYLFETWFKCYKAE